MELLSRLNLPDKHSCCEFLHGRHVGRRLAVLVTKHAVLSAANQGAGGAAVWAHREFLPQAWHVSQQQALPLYLQNIASFRQSS